MKEKLFKHNNQTFILKKGSCLGNKKCYFGKDKIKCELGWNLDSCFVHSFYLVLKSPIEILLGELHV
jgi:hypothetical protein